MSNNNTNILYTQYRAIQMKKLFLITTTTTTATIIISVGEEEKINCFCSFALVNLLPFSLFIYCFPSYPPPLSPLNLWS